MWKRYHDAFADLEAEGLVRRPIVPPHCTHNAHMYYLILPSLEIRRRVLEQFSTAGIGAIFHYVPLHSAPAGRRYGRAFGSLPFTEAAGERLLRLPLWFGLEDRLDSIVESARDSIVQHSRPVGAGLA